MSEEKLNLDKDSENKEEQKVDYSDYDFNLDEAKEKLKKIFSMENIENAEWMKNRFKKEDADTEEDEDFLTEFMEEDFEDEIDENPTGFRRLLEVIKSLVIAPWVLIVQTIPAKLIIMGKQEILETLKTGIIMSAIYAVYSIIINLVLDHRIEIAGDYTSLLTSVGALIFLVGLYYYVSKSEDGIFKYQLVFDGEEEVSEDLSTGMETIIDKLNTKVNSIKSEEIKILTKEEIIESSDYKVLSGDSEVLNNQEEMLSSLEDLAIKRELNDRIEVTEEDREKANQMLDFSDLLNL